MHYNVEMERHDIMLASRVITADGDVGVLILVEFVLWPRDVAYGGCLAHSSNTTDLCLHGEVPLSWLEHQLSSFHENGECKRVLLYFKTVID